MYHDGWRTARQLWATILTNGGVFGRMNGESVPLWQEFRTSGENRTKKGRRTVAAQYWTYQEMRKELTELCAHYPALMTLDVIGQSREGRDMLAVTLTQSQTGAANNKSAILVDANIHAGEVAGNAAAMYWIRWCLEHYGTNPEATELLDGHAVYVIPRIALDGAELYLTTAERVRSSPHPYPYSTIPDGFIEEDIDDNGHILMMRMPAADGAFTCDALDPRIMRPRRPGESGGTYYHVFPEGRLDIRAQRGSWPALSAAKRAARRDMDFNRNFPIRWAGESGQHGAGPFPLSEPELRHLSQFVLDHPNIAAYAALHTSGGVILRQPSTGEDTVLSVEDRELFTRVAEVGRDVSGYFADSNYHIFASGHEAVLMPGAADDWMYDHWGVLGFTVEIWNLPRRAGARGYAELGVRRLSQLTLEQRLEDERKIYAWVTAEVGADGIFPWTRFEHPDFGPVEIGGLNPKFVRQNPPRLFLEEECAHVGGFLTRLGLSTPRLIFTEVRVQALGAGLYRLVAEVANAGYLPTSSTAKGRDLLLEGVAARLDGDATILAGISPTQLGHLSGYGGQSGFNPPHRQRAAVEWIIQAKPGAVITITGAGPRAGAVSTRVTLPQEGS